ncbi:uncharacterized protein [Coffea arabica]|uniref:Arabidopsis retrotransposon Orf1 C-terminal domain-containing protein n=1 Tax=Coffea arabica TaxID=13443 RepID=A0ABM4UQ35_COFAR
MVRPKSSSRSRASRSQPPPQASIPVNTPSNLPSSSSVRTRLGRGRGAQVDTPAHFGGHLTFTRPADQQRYAKVCERRIIPCKTWEKLTVMGLGIREELEQMFTAIGWLPYLDILCPAFVELTREFYSTFEFEFPTRFTVETPNVIRFRLMGREFNFSITQFNLAFGFITREYAETREYGESACDYIESFLSRYRAVWEDMSTDRHRYDPSRSRSSFLKDPSARYVHRFLAYSYSGRKDSSGILSRPEFFFIWSMKNNIKVNLGCWLAAQFKTVLAKKNKPLILGSYITHLATQLGILNLEDHDLHLACEMELLDVDCLEKMGVVERLPDGSYQFIPPGPVRAPGAHPSTRAGPSSFPGSAEDTAGPSSSAPPPPHGTTEWQQLREQVQALEARMVNVDANVAGIAQNLAQFLLHTGFAPSCPPRPPF